MLFRSTRVLWVAAAVSTSSALDGSAAVAHRGALALVWWILVGAVVVALVVPGCLALTAVRAVAPALVPSAAGLLVATSTSDASSTGTTLAAGAALVLLVAMSTVALSAEFGEVMVQASAYGHERRLPLRAPASAVVAIGTTWAVWTLLVTATTVLVATDHEIGRAHV